MKKLLLICFCWLNTPSVFSELPEKTSNLDVNWIETKKIVKPTFDANQYQPFKLNNMLSTASFDSVRYLDEVNDSTAADAFPWISANGCRLYYTHANLTNSLFLSERINVNLPWTIPVNLNVTGTSFTLSRNELELFACEGNGIVHYERVNSISPFTNPQILTMNLPVMPSFYRSLSFDSAGTQMFVYAFYSGGAKLIEMTKLNQFTYDFVREITFPAGFTSTNGRISNDGLTFYLSMTPVTSLSNLGRMERASLADTFNASTAQIIPELFDSSNYSVQPSASQNDEWLVYAKAVNNIWSETNLFIASKTGVINSVSENMKLYASVFPNPASCFVNFKFNSKNNTTCQLNVYSLDGRLLISNTISNSNQVEIDAKELNSGLYFFSLISGNEMYQSKFVIQK